MIDSEEMLKDWYTHPKTGELDKQQITYDIHVLIDRIDHPDKDYLRKLIVLLAS